MHWSLWFDYNRRSAKGDSVRESFSRDGGLSGCESITDSQDQGPEEGKKKGVGRDLNVSLYDTMKHQGQNPHQATQGNVSLGFTRRKGANSGKGIIEEMYE